jgi:single-stranded DNA-binding protein
MKWIFTSNRRARGPVTRRSSAPDCPDHGSLWRYRPDGEREESTEWLRVSVAGRQATYASQFARGQRVRVIGRLQITHFERRDGTHGTGFDLWADEVVNVSGRATVAQDCDAPPPDQPRAVHRTSETTDDDELPF